MIDSLSVAMSVLWPEIPPDHMRAFGNALSNVFGMFTQITATNVLTFAAQTEVNRLDIEAIRGKLNDQRTLAGDLLSSRDDIEVRLDKSEARLTALEARLDRVGRRVDLLDVQERGT